MLHSQTTLILAALLFLVLPLLMWWATAGQRSAAMAWWCTGSLVMGTGIVLMGARPWVPAWLSYHVSNTFMLAGLMLWPQSLRVMQGQGWRYTQIATAVLLGALYYSLLFIFVEPHLRGMGMRAALGTLSLYTAWRAWGLPQRQDSHNATAIAACYLLLGVGLWIQILSVGINKDPSPFSSSWDASVIALVALATSAVGHFCFTGMVLDASAREQVEAVQARSAADENTRLENQLRLLDRQSRMLLISGSMTHELNQPLNAALTQAQEAQRALQAGEADHVDLSTRLEQIASDMRQASVMLERIRATARVHGVMRMERLDLREVLHATSDLFLTEWRQQDMQVDLLLGNEPLWCDADEVALSQLMMNLLRNATQETSEPQRFLKVRTLYTDTALQVVIQNHVNQAQQKDPVGRDGTMVRQGAQDLEPELAIARTIAQQHGGYLSRHKHPLGGSEWVLTLPRASRRPA